MSLTQQDRRFLQTVERLKVYLLLLGCVVLIYVLVTPTSELQMATSVIGVALCGVFWLTQRLLTCISALDMELTRIANAVKRALPEEQRKQLSR